METGARCKPPLYMGLAPCTRVCSKKYSKYLCSNCLDDRTFLYIFVPKKRGQLCFQKVVRMVAIRQSKYCYKNATLMTYQNI